VWVVTGDYKLQPDPTCLPFEPVRCHTLITESTFGLPIYRWDPPAELFAGVNAWWRANQAAGKTSLVYAYALGKAQRVMAGIDPAVGPIYTHGAVEKVTRAYRESGVSLPPTTPVGEVVAGGRGKAKPWAGALVIAPPSAAGSPWARKFEPASEAFASGWMRVRGARRRKAVDRGFALSDHADWPGLLTAVRESGAARVLATHGFAAVLARHLREGGLDAEVVATRFGDEGDGADPAAEEAP
jgi:putative mRNA 3-end processing factor